MTYDPELQRRLRNGGMSNRAAVTVATGLPGVNAQAIFMISEPFAGSSAFTATLADFDYLAWTDPENTYDVEGQASWVDATDNGGVTVTESGLYLLAASMEFAEPDPLFTAVEAQALVSVVGTFIRNYGGIQPVLSPPVDLIANWSSPVKSGAILTPIRAGQEIQFGYSVGGEFTGTPPWPEVQWLEASIVRIQ